MAVVAAVAAMVGGLLVTGNTGAIAHGTCAPQADTPVKDAASITAVSRISCNDQHAKYVIFMYLQRRNSDGTWSNVAGPGPDTTFNTDTGHATEAKSCTSGTYRSKMTDGRVYNASNAQVHPSSGGYMDTSGNNTISC